MNIFQTKLGDEKTFLGARAVTQEDGASGNGGQYADNGYGRKQDNTDIFTCNIF